MGKKIGKMIFIIRIQEFLKKGLIKKMLIYGINYLTKHFEKIKK